ncbi:MAG TPA: histidine kinase dimerization/phosphoacceptor domain -containing protein [Spirochaetales bacterium]|nr:histidine kinase dimerization/phosphoacceptor domain -containing protein [Spirochaetales bacterium]
MGKEKRKRPPALRSTLDALDERGRETFRKAMMLVLGTVAVATTLIAVADLANLTLGWDFVPLAILLTAAWHGFFRIRSGNFRAGIVPFVWAAILDVNLEPLIALSDPLSLSSYLLTNGAAGAILGLMLGAVGGPLQAALAFGSIGLATAAYLAGSGSRVLLEALPYVMVAWVILGVIVVAISRIVADFVARIKDETESNRRALAALEEAARIREGLLREIEHRVYNNLQVMRSLLSLEATGAARDGEALARARGKVRTLALACECIRESDAAAVPLEDLARRVVHDLVAEDHPEFPQADVDFELEDSDIDVDRAGPFALALHALVERALPELSPLKALTAHSPAIKSLAARPSEPGRLPLRVALKHSGPDFVCEVSGPGTSAEVGPVASALARQLDGRVERLRGALPFAARLSFPLMARRKSPPSFDLS